MSSVDVVHHINSLGDSYKIESKNEMLQCSIDFTRDIYQFRDIKQYPFDIDIGSDADTEEGVGCPAARHAMCTSRCMICGGS